MALQTGVFKFTGRLGNVIGYRRNGKHFFRSMPDKVRQTSATRRASRYFGAASRKGKLIRKAFAPYVKMRDGSLVNRLNKLLIQFGRNNIQALRGFHFNRHTGTEKFFALPPVFSTDGMLTIPAQELFDHGRNTHVEVRLIAVRINFAERRVISADASTAVINLEEDAFNGMALSVPVEGDGTLMVVLQCQACTVCNGELCPSGDRRYMAADIINITAPAEKATTIEETQKDYIRPLIRVRIPSRSTNVIPPVSSPQRE